jgi:hypothetical protein
MRSRTGCWARIEPELAAERLAGGALGILAEHGVDRIAGDEVDDREHDQRHEEEHRDDAEEATAEIGGDAAHAPPPDRRELVPAVRALLI